MSQIKLFDHMISVGITAKNALSAFDTSAYSTIFCLVDENTEKHCLPVFKENFKGEFQIICIASGEENKTFETCTEIWRQLLSNGANRESLLINLGGGVICDTGGFVAGNFKRGISFVNIPTTLLAMVDAAIGGKTGVNVDSLKNQIGSFEFPEAVYVMPEFLNTLTEQELKQGYAEILKHALIADFDLWQSLKSENVDFATDENLLAKSIRIKTSIVEEDPEEKEKRKLLNFGHTIGHAIESWSQNNSEAALSHGEAVSIGIIAESFLSYRKSNISFDELKEICDTVYLYFNPVYLAEDKLGEIIELMQYDKKNKNDEINFTLLKNIGIGIIDQTASKELILESLEFYKTFPDRNYIAQK
ncbi:MAG: 3-dehydroquinate synthase [Bacteroidia bacterium]|nr:3-dehydroquinate synthase [Bacteroidia bacterium]NNM15181.1 3-dehydroquinate synthase [Bacteroidia bacterium]